MQEMDYGPLVDEATNMLLQGFGAMTDELFKETLIISNEPPNKFAKLPTHVKMSIIQNVFQKGLAQTLASLLTLSGGQVTEKEIFSVGTTVLKHHFKMYIKGFKEMQNAGNLGKGSEGGAGSEPRADGDVAQAEHGS